MHYQVFLSYTHADEKWARWLMRRLESYRVPKKLVGSPGCDGPIAARLGPVFRDRDELASSSDLSSTIKAALDQSKTLVVLCSPTAAQSRWVNAEISAFHATGRADRILCFVVDGDPSGHDLGRACIPPQLVRMENGSQREPLAADARPEGDGRERAFLKLVAGLLGISYDSLAPREAQRRQRRLVLVTAMSLAGMSVALALAATAYSARNDAHRRQVQAEDIVDFMIGDLRKKLSAVGRLDLMRAVDDKASKYFAALDTRDLSDHALETQARSLAGIGQVRLSEGDYQSSTAAFREAFERSSALYQREPTNGQRLFDLAQAQYWIGLVALQQGSLDLAGVWFRKYRDSTIELAAMGTDNFDWQKEVAWAQHNLGVLDERLGRYPEAEEQMRSKRELYRSWMAQRPNDLELRSEDANTASWLGSIAIHQGKLSEAEAFFAEQVAEISRNVADDPTNADWKETLADALLLLVEAQVLRGYVPDARKSLAAATSVADALSEQDPSNSVWQVTPGICQWWHAQLTSSLHETSPISEAAVATATLEKALALQPQSERVIRWLAKALNQQTQLALGLDNAAEAQAHIAKSVSLLEPLWAEHPSESLRIVLASSVVLSGEAAAAAGDSEGALVHWRRAEELLVAGSPGVTPFERLDPLVRALRHLNRKTEAEILEQRLSDSGYVPLQPFPS